MSNRKLNIGNVFNGFKSRIEKSEKNRANVRRDETAKRRNTNAHMIDAMESSGSTDTWLIKTDDNYAPLGQLNRERKPNPFVVNGVQYYEFAQALLTREQLNSITNVVPDDESIKYYTDLDKSIVKMSKENYKTLQKADSKRLQDEKVEMELEENRKIIKKANEESKIAAKPHMIDSIKHIIVEYGAMDENGNINEKHKKFALEALAKGEYDGLYDDIIKFKSIMPMKLWDAIRLAEKMKSKIKYFLLSQKIIDETAYGFNSNFDSDYNKGIYNYYKELYFDYNGDMDAAHQGEIERIAKINEETAKAYDKKHQNQYEEYKNLQEQAKKAEEAKNKAEAEAKAQNSSIFNWAMSAVGNTAKNVADDVRQRTIAGLAIRELPSIYHTPYKQPEVEMSDDFAAVAREARRLYNMELERIDADRAKSVQPVHISYADLARQAGKNVTIQKQSQNKNKMVWMAEKENPRNP